MLYSIPVCESFLKGDVFKMESRSVIHIDLDSFFASVEAKKDPSLKGKAIIVGGDGDPKGRGVVSAASYEARAKGVSSGMPLKKALKLCPGAVFLPVDFASYEAESERFMEILRSFTAEVETFGLDEAFLEIKTAADPFPHAVEMAGEIRSRVKRELKLAASAGIGPNKLIAKMASEAAKPDGLFVIRDGEVGAFLKDLPVRRLWGVGPKTEKRLNDLSIRTIGELARTPVLHLERNFGPVIGRTLHEHANGRDESPVVPFSEPGSFGREVTFETDTADLYIVKETLSALAGDVTARLKSEGRKARKVSIKVRFSDFKTITREKTFDSETDSLNDIRPSALSLLESVDMVRPLRLIGIRVMDLTGAK